jgi:hypothetical protein
MELWALGQTHRDCQLLCQVGAASMGSDWIGMKGNIYCWTCPWCTGHVFCHSHHMRPTPWGRAGMTPSGLVEARQGWQGTRPGCCCASNCMARQGRTIAGSIRRINMGLTA